MLGGAMRNVLTLVLGGGRGTRLYPLTKYRSKPAVPLGGKYRLIDIPLSNCINSGLNRIYVLTQFLSVSLHRHIRQAYRFDHFSGGFVEILAAQQTEEGGDWYQGTADAVRKQLRYVQQRGIDYVLILSGDQLYRMDYRDLLQTHIQSGAEVTIGAIPVTREAAKAFGLLQLDDSGRVTGFLEKPQTHEAMDTVRMEPSWMDARGVQSNGRDLLASMGIYVFNRDALVQMLTESDNTDFGKEVFPAAIESRPVMAHLFDGYWEDVGTVRASYEANLSLAGDNPEFNLNCPEAPVYTRPRFLPPARLGGATITDSLIADGCIIGPGTVIENSVIGLRSIIGPGVTIRNSVLMGADEYQLEEQCREDRAADRPLIGIGAGTLIENAIVDKNCRIGRNVRILNERGIENSEDAEDCVIRDGVPVVIKEALLPDGWSLESRTAASTDKMTESLTK